jgi:chromosome segregation ATPase
MQIDISNLPPEVETLHKLIVSLHGKNNDWSAKCQKLSKQNTQLAGQNTSLINKYTKLTTDNTELPKQNTELNIQNNNLSQKNTELSVVSFVYLFIREVFWPASWVFCLDSF